MTLQLKLTNVMAGKEHIAKVEVFQMEQGRPIVFPELTKTLAPGEETTITIWGDRGFTVTEQLTLKTDTAAAPLE